MDMITVVVRNPTRIYAGRKIGDTEILMIERGIIRAYKNGATYQAEYKEGDIKIIFHFVCEGVPCDV